MTIPIQLKGTFDLPLIAAPMFLVSGPELVIESCRNGVIGTFPALNQRNSEGLEAWLIEIERALSAHQQANPDATVAPYGINLIVHPSNTRLEADLALCVKYKVPLVITSVGAPGGLTGTIQNYGGLVFHDIANMKHARKAISAGVDGLIVLSCGAGGQTGTLNPFGLVRQIRQEYDGAIVLAGSLSDGRSLRAAEILGADFGYMGTRFVATQESLAGQSYMDMIIDSDPTDIICTDKASGLKANIIRQSLIEHGIEWEGSGEAPKTNMANYAGTWTKLRSAGHGVGVIQDAPTVAQLIARLKNEYQDTVNHPVN
jgi:nitronate monooxygenase